MLFFYRFSAVDKQSKTALARHKDPVRGQKQSFRNFRPSNTLSQLRGCPEKVARLSRLAHLELFSFKRVLIGQMVPFDRGVLSRGPQIAWPQTLVTNQRRRFHAYRARR